MHATLASAASHAASPVAAPAPIWARGGGAGILIGGVLLLAATVVEAFLWDGADLITAFAALFLASTVAHALAMLPLALGSTGADGIAGGRMLGTVALLAFGAVFLLNQTLYFVTAYGPSDGDGVDTSWLAPVLGATQLALLLTAAIVVVRAGRATGAARWALLALSVVAIVTGLTATAADDPAVITVALIASTVSQIVTGVVLLAHRPPVGRDTVG